MYQKLERCGNALMIFFLLENDFHFEFFLCFMMFFVHKIGVGIP